MRAWRSPVAPSAPFLSSLSLPLRRSYASSKLIRSRDLQCPELSQLHGARLDTWLRTVCWRHGPLSHTTAVAVLRQSHPLMRHYAKLIFERGWSSRFPSYTVTSPASGNYSVLQKKMRCSLLSVYKNLSPPTIDRGYGGHDGESARGDILQAFQRQGPVIPFPGHANCLLASPYLRRNYASIFRSAQSLQLRTARNLVKALPGVSATLKCN
jgi:hypothetical protein